MPVDQPALPTGVQLLPVATPLPDSTSEHAAPAAPRQRAEAPDQQEVVKAAPSPQTVKAPAAPTSVSVDATPSPLPQDAQAAASAQSAALPAVGLTPRMPAALPRKPAPSPPSNLAATMSQSYAASPAGQLAPRGAETSKALPDSTLQHAVPAAPRQHAEAPEQKEAVAATPSPQTVEAPVGPTSVSADATSSPPPQDAQAASPAYSAALPLVQLTPRVPAALPETALPSTPSNLPATTSPSPAAPPAAPLTPVAFAPETAIHASSDAGTSKAPPVSQPVRRGTYPRATPVSVPVDQQALPTDVQPLPVAPPPPDNAPEHAAPTAPRQHVETPEQKEIVRAASSQQTVAAPGPPTSVSVDATTPSPSQDVQAAAPAQSAALPAIELTPRVPAALPETAGQSTPPSLATAASPVTHRIARRAACAGARADGPCTGWHAAADHAARSARTGPGADPHRASARCPCAGGDHRRARRDVDLVAARPAATSARPGSGWRAARWAQRDVPRGHA